MMLPIMPGDRLVIGGGMFRRVLQIELSVDVHEVVLMDKHMRKERICYHQLVHHLCEGFVVKMKEKVKES